MQDAHASGQEMLDSIFDKDRDRGAPESAAPAAPVEQPAMPVMPQDAVSESPPPVQEGNDRVPLAELLKEREKRKEYERQLAEVNQRAEFYANQARMQQQRQQMPPQVQPQAPDPWTDPEGAIQFHVSQAVSQVQQNFLNQQAHLSEAIARQRYGDQLCNQALMAAQQTGMVEQFRQTPNPWVAMAEWYRNVSALQQIGPDPEAYKAKLREEILAELKGGGAPAPAGQPQNVTRFPGSLATATAGGSAAPSGGPVSQQAMMDALFSPQRHAKG